MSRIRTTLLTGATLAAFLPTMAAAWNFGFNDDDYPYYGPYGPYAPYAPYAPNNRGWGWGGSSGPRAGGPDVGWGSGNRAPVTPTPPREDADVSINRGTSWKSNRSTFSWGNRWSPNVGNGWRPGSGPNWGFSPGWYNYPPGYNPYAPGGRGPAGWQQGAPQAPPAPMAPAPEQAMPQGANAQ